MKRLFIGTFADREIFEYVYPEILEDFAGACEGKPVELENLHFTWQFLGDVEDDVAPRIKQALEPLSGSLPIRLDFEGLGCFPNPARPRVLFANIYNPGGELLSTWKKIIQTTKEFGFTPDKKPFRPHLTMMRIKRYDKTLFKEALERYSDKFFGTMNEIKIDLIESELTRKGPKYHSL